MPPDALIDLPFVGWLFRMLPRSRARSRCRSSSSRSSSRCCCSGRAGACAPGPWASIPRPPRRWASTSSALRYRNVILGGLFAGLAGAWFTLDFGNSFQSGMTNGRGFIALAALIFGRWTPVGAFARGAPVRRLGLAGPGHPDHPAAGPAGRRPRPTIPEQFWTALPYIVTIVVLAGVVGRSIPPAAVGKPYERESVS